MNEERDIKREILEEYFSYYMTVDSCSADALKDETVYLSSKEIADAVSSTVTVTVDEVTEIAKEKGFSLALSPDGVMRWVMIQL